MLTKSPETAAPEVALWRPGGFADDGWVFVDSVGEMPPAGRVIVPLAVWREVRASNARDAWQIGVALAPDDAVEDILPDLDHVALISLDFPKFTDGRPYSAARLLRERYGFAGEIRATGDVLLDQIPFMIRCGFDAFAISHEPTRRALAAGRLPEVPIFLQPAGERGEVPYGTRPWLRRRA